MNCIWITVDSFRQDHLRCYRPQGTTDPTGESLLMHTPNIDRLASEGLRCDRLRSEALPTVPCRRGIFTGRRVFPWRDEPARKGDTIRAPGWRPLPDEELTDGEHHHVRARYAAECSLVDHWVGRLLNTVDRLGLKQNTLIVFLSDHGKIIGEFNHYGMRPEDTGLELNSVPCILRHPRGDLAGRRWGSWLYNTDVTATVLSLLDAEPRPLTDGESFWPAAVSDADLRDHAVVGHLQMVSCWQDDWLLLADTARNTSALYHLGEDPLRRKDVADRYPDVRDALTRRIEAVAGG